MEAISLPPDYPPSELWLIHDFMSLSINEMKYIYKELIREGTTTLCQDDITELEICWEIKQYNEKIDKEKKRLLKIGKEIINQPKKIPFMKKPNRKK
tara:strand:- start:411 stop:701 length:291 start_codon:yes stop_codon:yes gene_type:complete